VAALHEPKYVIAVLDLQRSIEHYRDVLGFQVFEIGDPGWRFFVRDQCIIMAGECPDAMPVHDLGDHSYFAYINVDGIDDLHAEFAAKGATILSTPRDEPWKMREFAIRTIDGHRIKFGSRI
jgi:catechol 2,3-dioxygenase-like lactoylglutathione lyase family enzyme